MAMLRSAIRTALRRTASASRFFSSIARGSPGCRDATSALRRPALTTSFFGSGERGSSGCKRMLWSYGYAHGARGFWSQGSGWTCGNYKACLKKNGNVG